jgi:hypothetical protein
MDSIKHRCFREAIVQQKISTGKTYYVHNTTWKDKKQVTFLHTGEGGTIKEHTVKLSIHAHLTQNDFALCTSMSLTGMTKIAQTTAYKFIPITGF